MRLIDAHKLMERIDDGVSNSDMPSDWHKGVAYALWHINRSPSIDAVETVRCANCKHRTLDGDFTHFYWCGLHDRPVDDADYCAWGEESEVEE